MDWNLNGFLIASAAPVAGWAWSVEQRLWNIKNIDSKVDKLDGKVDKIIDHLIGAAPKSGNEDKSRS